MILVIFSFVLLIYGIYSWSVELKIKGSEWLPIMFSSSLNLFLLFVYWLLGIGFIKPLNIKENKAVRFLAQIGFGGNILLFICSILIIVGFGIIP